MQHILNLSVPSAWIELTDGQLRFVFHLLAREYSLPQIKSLCLLKWAKVHVLHREGAVFIVKYNGKRYPVDPFFGVEVTPEIYGTPFYLTVEERNKVADFDLSYSSALSLQRDIFIFQCLIGCRMGDLYALKWDNIVGNILVYTPYKTKDEHAPVTARVPISERALQLIERYRSIDEQGRLFPYISTQGYNDTIKRVLRKCGITRKVGVRNSLTGENEMRPICDVASSHMARRTFVGNAYKQVKDQSIVSKMSGHAESSKAFSRYRDIDDDTLAEVIKAMQ